MCKMVDWIWIELNPHSIRKCMDWIWIESNPHPICRRMNWIWIEFNQSVDWIGLKNYNPQNCGSDMDWCLIHKIRSTNTPMALYTEWRSWPLPHYKTVVFKEIKGLAFALHFDSKLNYQDTFILLLLLTCFPYKLSDRFNSNSTLNQIATKSIL